MEMTTKTQNGTQTGSATLKAYEDKVKAQVQEAQAKLEQFEAKAKEKTAQVDIAVISSLKTAKQHIDQKVHDLKTTHDAHVACAKADIDADVARFTASVDELAAKFKPHPATK
jgi:F0F1-type ATP synthase membrane subunit b/b'